MSHRAHAMNRPRMTFGTYPLLALVWLTAVSVDLEGDAAWAEPPARASRPANGLRSPTDIQICMLPLGRYDEPLMHVAAQGIRYVYGFSTKTLDARAMPETAYYKPRKRYRAEKILDYINDKVKDDSCFAIVGFTRYDISTTKDDIEDWGILGLGEVGGTAAVVSTYRLTRRVRRRQAAMRTVKVVNHELGHVLGLEHYDDEPGCVMNDARGTVKTVDQEKGLLCSPSRAYIEETHKVALPVLETFDWKAIALPR